MWLRIEHLTSMREILGSIPSAEESKGQHHMENLTL
jgi:hypothetical protein